ncbi:MAG: hypothetical protein ACREA0_28890, partial [bacterium]
ATEFIVVVIRGFSSPPSQLNESATTAASPEVDTEGIRLSSSTVRSKQIKLARLTVTVATTTRYTTRWALTDRSRGRGDGYLSAVRQQVVAPLARVGGRRAPRSVQPASLFPEPDLAPARGADRPAPSDPQGWTRPDRLPARTQGANNDQSKEALEAHCPVVSDHFI